MRKTLYTGIVALALVAAGSLTPAMAGGYDYPRGGGYGHEHDGYGKDRDHGRYGGDRDRDHGRYGHGDRDRDYGRYGKDHGYGHGDRDYGRGHYGRERYSRGY